MKYKVIFEIRYTCETVVEAENEIAADDLTSEMDPFEFGVRILNEAADTIDICEFDE